MNVAGSVKEAKELVMENEYDLVVSDIGLPDGDGWQLLQELKQRRPSLRGIAMSGFGMSTDIQRSRDAGFSAHLTVYIWTLSARSNPRRNLFDSKHFALRYKRL